MHQGVRLRPPLMQNKLAVGSTGLRSSDSHENAREKSRRSMHLDEDERMKGLHTRLNQEADKIRKWKVQTELELKMKDQKVNECQETIEKLRKSSLELQLENENLSQLLEEEQKSKEEINLKINATRNMCNLLKDYTSKLDERMQKCEVEKTELKYVCKEHASQFECLSSKFNELEISTSQDKTLLREEIKREQDEKKQMGASYQQQLARAEHELQELLTKHKEKEKHLFEISQKLTNNQHQLLALRKEHENLVRTLNETRADLQLKMECLADVQKHLDASEKTRAELESRLEETNGRLSEVLTSKESSAKQFDETERLYVEMIKKHQAEKDGLQERLQSEVKRCSELMANVAKSHNNIEALKSEKDMLLIKKSEDEQIRERLKQEKDQLKASIDGLQRQISNLSDEKHDANSELVEMKLNVEKMKTKMEEMEEILARRTKNLEKSNTDIIHLKEEISERQERIVSLENSSSEEAEREKSLNEEIALLQQQLEEESGENKEVVQKSTSLSSENKSLQKELTKVSKELEKVKKKEADFKSKLDESKKDNKELRQNHADLEKKLKDNEQQFEKKIKQEVSDKDAALSTSEKQAISLKEAENRISNLLKDIGSKDDTIKLMEEEAKKLHHEVKKSKEDFSAVDQRCEAEIAQMTQVLGNYKNEYEDFIISKDKKIEVLEKEIKDVKEKGTSDAKDKGAAIAESRKETAQLHQELEMLRKASDEDKEKMTLLDQELREKEDEIAGLKRQNSEIEAFKVNELAQLNKKIDELQIAKPAVVVPQTPKSVHRINASGDGPMRKLTPKSVNTPNMRRAQNSKENTRTPKYSCGLDDLESPLQVAKTPQSNRSILKPVSTQSAKKRRVMFASSTKRNESDGNESDHSSSSEAAMELEIDEIEKRLKTPKAKAAATPMRVKPSPMCGTTTGPVVMSHSYMKQVPRGLSLSKNKTKEIQLASSSVNSRVVDATTPGETGRSKPEKKSCEMTPKTYGNVRKAQNRVGNKFFTSPKESKLKTLRQKKSEDMAWFESDSIFGFGPED